MIIPHALIDELLEHARAEAPLECCGLISAHDGELVCVIPCHNAAESETRYEVDGLEQLQWMRRIADDAMELGAIYHSHVKAPAWPSDMDVASAFYPDVLYLIVGLAEDVVRAFRIVDGEVTEDPLVIT